PASCSAFGGGNSMKPVTNLVLALSLVIGLSIVSSSATANQGKTSEAVVKVTAKSDKPSADGKQLVTITLNIDKDWHTYANPVGLEDLESAQTVVEITGKTKPDSIKLAYPKGKLHKDAVVGDYSIYEGKVEIKATVQRAKGDSGPLEVKVKLQA